MTVTANGSSGDFALANVNASASVGNLSFNGFEIDSLTLDFPGATIGTADWDNLTSLPTANFNYNYDSNISEEVETPEFDNLTLTANSITEDASAYDDAANFTYYEGVTVTGDASFTATAATGGIALGNAFNDFQGANGGTVSANRPGPATPTAS